MRNRSPNRLAERCLRKSHAVLTALAMGALVVMLFVGVADVLARYVFRAPIFGSSEIIALLLAVSVFSALPAVTGMRQHITVDMFAFAVPERILRPLDLCIDFAGSATLAIIAYAVGALALDYHAIGDLTTELSIPKAWVAGFVAFMCACAAVSLALPASVVGMPSDSTDQAT